MQSFLRPTLRLAFRPIPSFFYKHHLSCSYSSMTEEDDVPHFKFWEEPLGLPAAAGYGFFQGGPGSRFRLATKVGYGTTSSVWLAWDSSMNRCASCRSFNVFQLQLLPSRAIAVALGRLLDHFYLPGVEDDGEHLCLVIELGGNLHFIQQQLPDYGYLPLVTAKRILWHVLGAISHMHSLGIAHTARPSTLKANLPRTYEPTRSLDKMVTSYVTQKFPPPPTSLAQLASGSFKLSDFGNAQIVDSQTTDDITPLDLRPPEIVLGGDWDQSVDIWTFGCLAFHLLTRGSMFAPCAIPERNASIEDGLLFQMVCYSGDTFKRDFLSRCRRTLEFFNRDSTPKKFDAYIGKGLVNCVREGANGMMSDADVHAVALFFGKMSSP
ncbi:hypothetical protein EW146_g4246 [Bondarzewia mesenterica]|uniref:non-specific serine/threonine protein kinase n=1 Tax=Bondarzewia mesenterica TaxID=1095465 RepID=A0A4V3XF75_9AGAM|nr:hypothetical protein EW146_g4246 [Bondarzewia mesenterica]